MTSLAATLDSLLDASSAPRTVTPPDRPPAPRSPVDTGINPTMAFEVALGMLSLDEIAKKHGIPAQELREYAANPHFDKMVKDFKADLEAHGVSFRLKAALQAEIYMDTTLWAMANDPTTPSQTKLDFFKQLTRVGGLEPKPAAGSEGGPGFRLIINLGNETPSGRLIEAVAE